LIKYFISKEIEYINKKKIKKTDSLNLSSSVERFLGLFSGMVEYLKKKFLKKLIKKEEKLNDDNYENKKIKKLQKNKNKTCFTIINFILSYLHFIFLILFAYLSIFSANSHFDNKGYEARKISSQVISTNYSSNTYFSNKHLIDIYTQVRDIKNHTSFFSFFLLTPVRFTFVILKIKN